MASVNFLKLHGRAEVAAMLRHSAPDSRLQHSHSNRDIDLSRTSENDAHISEKYTEALERYDNRLAEIDAAGNANRRKDRVSCFGLCVPAPLGLTEEQERAFFWRCVDLMQERYGAENVVGSYAHFDEVHAYLDHGQVKESRPHLHLYVIPEIGGSLNGKAFSSRARMKAINNELEQICREEYGVPFMTGEEPRREKVEHLKRQSSADFRRREEHRQQLEERCEELEAQLEERTRVTAGLGEIKPEEPDRGLLGPRKTKTLPYEEYCSLVASQDALRAMQAAEMQRIEAAKARAQGESERIYAEAAQEAEQIRQRARQQEQEILREAETRREALEAKCRSLASQVLDLEAQIKDLEILRDADSMDQDRANIRKVLVMLQDLEAQDDRALTPGLYLAYDGTEHARISHGIRSVLKATRAVWEQLVPQEHRSLSLRETARQAGSLH